MLRDPRAQETVEGRIGWDGAAWGVRQAREPDVGLRLILGLRVRLGCQSGRRSLGCDSGGGAARCPRRPSIGPSIGPSSGLCFACTRACHDQPGTEDGVCDDQMRRTETAELERYPAAFPRFRCFFVINKEETPKNFSWLRRELIKKVPLVE